MSAELQRVWLILAKIRVIGENPIGLTVGSEALIQCFVPETMLEMALADCDRLLQKEGKRRTDVLSCSSFEGDDTEVEAADFIKDDIAKARASGEALTGTFFTSEDTSSFEQPHED